MAKSKDNIATHGLSGNVDRFWFRQWFGSTVVTKRRKPSNKQPGADTLSRRDRFRQAIRFAKAVIKNALNRAFYTSKAKPGQTAFNMACADFYSLPEIGEINSDAYNGVAGDRILVPVSEQFKVVSVMVRIEKGDGSLVEEGAAVLTGDELHWEYASTAANASVAGSIITVTASDLPGNSSVKQKTL
jgi:hypothetical protein